MKSNAASAAHETPAESTCVLRWLLARGDDRLTCDLSQVSDGRLQVSVFPHWNIARAIVVRLDHPIEAFERHAAVVQQLRESGWSVISRQAEGPRAGAGRCRIDGHDEVAQVVARGRRHGQPRPRAAA
jgi:hypothetical protein